MRSVVGAGLYLVSLMFFSNGSAAEKTIEYSVQVAVSLEESPARITLHWVPDTCCQPQSYTIYRKAVADNTWKKRGVLSGGTLEYADSEVSLGARYEYQVVKNTPKY